MQRVWTGWVRASRTVLVVLGTLLVGVSGAVSGAGQARAQGAPTVQTGQTSTLGAVLTGSNGRTLYTFDRDTAGASNCNDACAQTWPPLVLDAGAPTAAAGVGGALSVITRADGRRQVARDGAPLYFYAPDTAPGETKGDGVGGVWHAAKPLAAAAAAAPAQAGAGAGAGASGLPRTGTGVAQAERPGLHGMVGGLLALGALGAGLLAVRAVRGGQHV